MGLNRKEGLFDLAKIMVSIILPKELVKNAK